MSKEVAFKNRDRFIQLGITVATLRRLRGYSQETLAERAGISRTLLSFIEAPGLVKGFSMEVFFDLADALNVDPIEMLKASLIPDSLIDGTKKDETTVLKKN